MDDNKISSEQNNDRIKRLRYIDDAFMRACLKDNPEAVTLIIRIILSFDDLTLISINIQSDFKNLYGRSVLLDVHAIGKDNKEYAIEFQRAVEGANPERVRHISALLDAQVIKSGTKTEDMPESYVILISERDVFNDKCRALYMFDRYDIKDGKVTSLNDGSHIVYVNGEYVGDDPIGKLIHDLLCENPDKMHYNELAKRAEYFKHTEEGVKKLKSVLDEVREEGALESSKSTAIRLIKLGKISLEDIAAVTQLPFEDVQKLQAQILQPT